MNIYVIIRAHIDAILCHYIVVLSINLGEIEFIYLFTLSYKSLNRRSFDSFDLTLASFRQFLRHKQKA